MSELEGAGSEGAPRPRDVAAASVATDSSEPDDDLMPVTATADPSGNGVILATTKRGKVFRCTQLNCWHCFAMCPRRM